MLNLRRIFAWDTFTLIERRQLLNTEGQIYIIHIITTVHTHTEN